MKRIKWIDISKGITILLVVAGHTIGTALIRGPIFSFHMPLFFVLSAYTMRYSSSVDEFKKRNAPFILKTLGLAYGLFLLHRLIQFVVEFSSGITYLDYLKTTAWGVFWSSGTAVVAFGNEYIKIGMMWFLVVFVLARCIFDYIHLICKNINHICVWGGGYCIINYAGRIEYHQGYLPSIIV